MKKSLLLAMFGLGLILASCKKDDPEPDLPEGVTVVTQSQADYGFKVSNTTIVVGDFVDTIYYKIKVPVYDFEADIYVVEGDNRDSTIFLSLDDPSVDIVIERDYKEWWYTDVTKTDSTDIGTWTTRGVNLTKGEYVEVDWGNQNVDLLINL